jgi:hypothetical protein
MFAVHTRSSIVALGLLALVPVTENRFSQYHKNDFNGRDFLKKFVYLFLPRRGYL